MASLRSSLRAATVTFASFILMTLGVGCAAPEDDAADDGSSAASAAPEKDSAEECATRLDITPINRAAGSKRWLCPKDGAPVTLFVKDTRTDAHDLRIVVSIEAKGDSKSVLEKLDRATLTSTSDSEVSTKPAAAREKIARKTIVIVVKHAEKRAVDEVKFTLPKGLDLSTAQVTTDYYGGLGDLCGEDTGLGCYVGKCYWSEHTASSCAAP